MLNRFKDKMTYANVVSTAALVIVVAGGGAATAAALIPNNSVNSAKIVNNSVRSIDIKDGVLHTKDLTTGAVGVVKGYAWMNSAGATANPLTNSYLYNSAGGAISSTRNSAGNYTVTFTDLDIFPGHVQVTAYGGGSTTCKVVSWGGSSANVACFNDAGAATDSQFTVAMIE